MCTSDIFKNIKNLKRYSSLRTKKGLTKPLLILGIEGANAKKRLLFQSMNIYFIYGRSAARPFYTYLNF